MSIKQWKQKITNLFQADVATQRVTDKRPAENSPGPGPQESYWADHPITTRQQDRFNRWPFAERIADTIGRRGDPSSLVLGVYGAWGDGKTSVLRLMEEALRGYPDIIIIRFNPWHFQSEAQLIRGFFETLADGLGRSLPTKLEELGRILAQYGSILSMASISLFQGVAQITPGAGLREFGETVSTVELDELRRRLERILREDGKRLVVFIDDIDRLDRQEIQATFKLVKLSAGFERTVYVLAFDDEMVADALGGQYGRGGPDAGRSFLEKIVQVPLHLPPADQLSLRELAFEGVNASLKLSGIELTEGQAQAFVHHFVDGLERRLVTPRQAKRYANGLAFALPILKGEVHPVDQMLLEGIRLFYPKLYIAIRENPDAFLKVGREGSTDETNRKRVRDIIDEELEGLDALEQAAAKDLLQVMFPRLKGVFGNTFYRSDWDERWAREQRICSDEYFQRYFRYSVPPRDIPDQAIAAFLEKAADSDEGTLGGILREYAGRNAGPRLIAKLRLCEDSVDPGTARRLAIAVARNASALPREETLFGFDSTFSQAAILVMKLVRRLPLGPEREDLARQLIQDADPTTFAFECFRWLRSDENEPESERLLPIAFEQELGTLLAGRIRELATTQPPYFADPRGSPALLWAWSKYGPEGEARAYLEARFAADPSETVKFLMTYVPTAWGADSGLPRKSDFGRDGYDAVARLVNPETVFGHLWRLYGAELETAEYRRGRDFPLEERVAHQFAHIHRKIKESENSPAEGTGREP